MLSLHDPLPILNGVTAYLALTLVVQPQAGETVLVSTAAGAVGSAVGQIAKIYGCRTVGIAGGSEKAQRCIQEFGYDAAIDYQDEDVADRVATLCPDGVDVYFDNTAGRSEEHTSELQSLMRISNSVFCLKK